LRSLSNLSNKIKNYQNQRAAITLPTSQLPKVKRMEEANERDSIDSGNRWQKILTEKDVGLRFHCHVLIIDNFYDFVCLSDLIPVFAGTDKGIHNQSTK
jgi:hypothetical protein